jgi:hypothetical protein
MWELVFAGLVGLVEKKRTSVSIPINVWEKLVSYFEEHERDLLDRRIKSPSGLASSWIEEGYLRAMAIEEGYLKGVRKK